MKLEEQVCSLELSKRLKELGVKQESLFYWIKVIGTDRWELLFNGDYDYLSIKPWVIDECAYSAFTVAELGEMLPGGMCQTDKINIKRDPDLKTYAIYLAGSTHMVKDNKEANARANMLIYFLKNKLMELPNEK